MGPTQLWPLLHPQRRELTVGRIPEGHAQKGEVEKGRPATQGFIWPKSNRRNTRVGKPRRELEGSKQNRGGGGESTVNATSRGHINPWGLTPSRIRPFKRQLLFQSPGMDGQCALGPSLPIATEADWDLELPGQGRVCMRACPGELTLGHPAPSPLLFFRT